MFEIRCIVADKRLHEALKMLAPVALEPPVAIPVNDGGAEEQNGTGHGRRLGAADLVKEFLDKMIKQGAKTVSARQFRDAMVAGGFDDRSYSYQLALLVKSKQLRKTREAGIYEVIR